MATALNLFVDQGSYFSKFVSVMTPNGTPYDLTNYTVSSQMRKNAGSSIAYNIPCEITAPVSGKVKIKMTAASTENIPPGRYLYDIEITDSTGQKLRVLEGVLTINPQMTRT